MQFTLVLSANRTPFYVPSLYALHPNLQLVLQLVLMKSTSWSSCGMRSCVLERVVRQQGDVAFVSMLNELRVGDCSHDTLGRLAQCHVSAKPGPRDDILPTKLYCTNRNVYVGERREDQTRACECVPSVLCCVA